MLEYFAYKKYKKNRADKEENAKKGEGENGKKPSQSPAPSPSPALASTPAPTLAVSVPAPVLEPDDESFFQSIVSDEGTPPPLPPRVKTPDLQWEHSDDERSRKSTEIANGKDAAKPANAGKKEGTASKVANRLSLIFKKDKKKADHLAPPDPEDVSLSEADRERRDMTKVLDDLNLSAKNGTAFSLSAESTELVRKFTLVLKDMVNGVPTAYDDLRKLLDDRDNVLAKNYEKLPSSMKKLITQLPNKMTSSLAPELLAVAAASQGIENDGKGGIAAGVKKLLMPHNLQELVTKPGAIVGMLRAIMNALKLRWPAFMGTNVIWSVGIFLLLFVLWYCHKRGREVRLEREKPSDVISDKDRIEELPDDPALPGPSTSAPAITTTESDPVLPPPPIGEHSPAHTPFSHT